MADLTELRDYDPAAVRAEWVAHGESLLHACPLCLCPKSGDSAVPNHLHDCHQGGDCPCHVDEDSHAACWDEAEQDYRNELTRDARAEER